MTNKTILRITHNGDAKVSVYFTDGTGLNFEDHPSCCENRYMVIDDDLTEYEGATYVGWEISPVSGVFARELAEMYATDDYGVHDVEFFRIMTSKGDLHIASHNEHNGYYGGFCIEPEDFTHDNP